MEGDVLMPFLDRQYLSQTIAPSTHNRDFVFGYLSALGASAQWMDDSLLRAELTRDQLCELEGRPVRTWYAQQNLPELVSLYLWLNSSQPCPDERAEAGVTDSWRFEQMRRSVSRIGSVTRLRMVPRREQDSTLYTPVICFGFEVALRCCRRIIRPVAVAVDLRTGASGEHLAGRILGSHLDTTYVPPSQLLPRELRFKHAFEIACEWVKEHITRDGATWEWHLDAIRRLRSELEQVKGYFAQLTRDGDSPDLAAAKAQALDEVRRRFEPRVEARALLAALVYCPVDELV